MDERLTQYQSSLVDAFERFLENKIRNLFVVLPFPPPSGTSYAMAVFMSRAQRSYTGIASIHSDQCAIERAWSTCHHIISKHQQLIPPRQERHVANTQYCETHRCQYLWTQMDMRVWQPYGLSPTNHSHWLLLYDRLDTTLMYGLEQHNAFAKNKAIWLVPYEGREQAMNWYDTLPADDKMLCAVQAYDK
jgi:hypothetical protein